MNRLLILLFSFLVFNNGFGQILETTHLPIVKITTNGGAAIVNEPRLNGQMQIIHEEGTLNNIDDTPNVYDGNIAIEIRGQTSQFLFDKKSYRLETQDEMGENLNVELLGMPKENDWILQGPYSDKTLIRNVLIYDLSRKIGQYAARTQLCELVINDEYMGVYALMEKLKRDKNRVDISKLDEDDIQGDSLTGGFIFRIDKFGAFDENVWFSKFDAHFKDILYQVVYPKPENIQPEQFDYISQFVDSFELITFGPDFHDKENGFRKYIDEDSFIDFFLLNELARNPDGYRISTYFHKNKDEKVKAGPIWDFNLGFGNVNFCAGSNYEGWILNYYQYCPNDNWQVPEWWGRLFSDADFYQKTVERWKSLRTDILSNKNIFETIDSLSAHLVGAHQRNFERWPILGEPIWPNDFVGATYSSEISELKRWLTNRLWWMDGHIENTSQEIIIPNNSFLKLFPNPVLDELNFEILTSSPAEFSLRLFDSTGRTIVNSKVIPPAGQFFQQQIEPNVIPQLSAGIYFLQILRNGEIWQNRKFLKL